jgi:hypothetical protein
MKTKIPLLFAVALFLTTVTKAQYGGGYGDNRVSVHGQIVIPGVAFGYGYNNAPIRYYDDRRDRRYDDHNNYGYDDRRDRREVEYERYCRDRRDNRMSREEFYRDHCDNNRRPYFPPHREANGRY